MMLQLCDRDVGRFQVSGIGVHDRLEGGVSFPIREYLISGLMKVIRHRIVSSSPNQFHFRPKSVRHLEGREKEMFKTLKESIFKHNKIFYLSFVLK